jgi:hypothetical protein
MFCNIWYLKVNVVDEVPAYHETLAIQSMSNQSYATPVGVAMH